ncbi:MBL fold metallo-hydrolase [Mycobacterium sp. GA-1285]|uniref:MBL fold metallo-hydrolase n=1 Tax=Mycobacterium sp. GA-1285 TaxID=1772282 RepID=UPI00074A3441|nr:MBL fold metallo-hydrolase [Mycobacterium sp. GA-1285]KUI22620.1 MBL fold metallo-hydrolase [Mycobacterium sp. GA-1285]
MTTSTTHDLTRIRDDLWQTRTDTPFPGLTTHAYLWRGPSGNVLFYSPASEADFDAIDSLGGISAQYLSHLDEAGPNLKRIEERFGRRLHAPEAELDAITKHARVDVGIGTTRHIDDNGVEAIPTPGHSRGSTSYLVTGVTGERYLFTGDTMFPTASGTWATFLVPGRGDAHQLRESVQLLGTVAPDVVISSAFGGETAWMAVDSRRWADCVAQALATVPS